jgi:hypothetical protein
MARVYGRFNDAYIAEQPSKLSQIRVGRGKAQSEASEGCLVKKIRCIFALLLLIKGTSSHPYSSTSAAALVSRAFDPPAALDGPGDTGGEAHGGRQEPLPGGGRGGAGAAAEARHPQL